MTADGELVRASADENPELLLGAARRRRQLRRGDRARVPPAPGGPGGAGRPGAATRPSAARELLAAVPRPDARRARGARPRLRLHDRSGRAGHPRGAARQAGGRWSAGMYAGPVEEGEAVLRELRALRAAGGRLLRADALRGLQLLDRRPARLPQLLDRRAPRPTCPTRRSTRSSTRCEELPAGPVAAVHRRRGAARWRGRRPRVAARRPRRRVHRAPARSSGRTRPTTSGYGVGPRFRRRPAPLRDRRAYLNFIGDEGGERVRAAFGAERHERLARVKASGTRATCSAATRASSRSCPPRRRASRSGGSAGRRGAPPRRRARPAAPSPPRAAGRRSAARPAARRRCGRTAPSPPAAA